MLSELISLTHDELFITEVHVGDKLIDTSDGELSVRAGYLKFVSATGRVTIIPEHAITLVRLERDGGGNS